MYCLGNPGKPVNVADELEAFLHVLIYGGVRRVRHNYNEIAGFVTKYFDDYSLDANGKYTVPLGKARVVFTDGRLRNTSDQRLIFGSEDGTSTDHPLDSMLIAELLPLFVARYRLLSIDKQQPRTKSSTNHPANAGAATVPRMSQWSPLGRRGKKTAQLANPKAMDWDVPVVTNEEELRKRAASLNSHDAFLETIDRSLGLYRWPAESDTA